MCIWFVFKTGCDIQRGGLLLLPSPPLLLPSLLLLLLSLFSDVGEGDNVNESGESGGRERASVFVRGDG
jgi:hypothetical protein